MRRYSCLIRAVAMDSLTGFLMVACAQDPGASSGNHNVPGARSSLVPAEAACC
jgi:hypothetical protein